MKKHEILKKTDLLSGLDDHDIKTVAKIAVESKYPTDTILFNEGDCTTSLYIILSGSVRAVSIDRSGQQIVHNTFKSGDYFGEMSFIDGRPRSARVETVEPSRILIIPREKMREIFCSNPDISFNIMKGLTRKLREATRQVEDLVFIVMQQELQDAHLDTINRLVLAAEYKDDNTGDHIARVSRYCAVIAEKLELPEEEKKIISQAAPMHDIGKIGIPEHILLKPGKLTEEEFNIIKTHTTIGARILSNPKSELLKCANQIALYHHEKFVGSGYPHAISGAQIPISAQIVGLVDTFDALISNRPYKRPYPVAAALDIIKKERGKHFSPVLVDIFFENIDAILKIREEIGPKAVEASSEFTWSERDRSVRGDNHLEGAG